MSTDKSIKNQLLYIFSSSQLILLYFILFYTVYKFNLYSFIILLIIVFKTIFLIPIKILLQKTNIGKRPKGAFNCNQYNCGGVPESGGFPSGHMLILGVLIMTVLREYVYEFINHRKHKNLIITYIIVIITTAFGRYFTNCHTLFQIISGFILGLIIGYILYLIDNLVEDKIEIYKKHKDIFYKDLDKIFSIMEL